MNPRNRDPNQGEGDRVSARKYNRDVRRFVNEGKVDEAAREARASYDRDPEGAARAEATAKRGPRAARGTRVSVDELVAKGRTVVDRVRPVVSRAAARLRARFSRSK